MTVGRTGKSGEPGSRRAFRRRVWAVVLLGLVLCSAPPLALAATSVSIDLSEQRMRVSIDGRLVHSWAVSTGRAGYRTPTGRFRPQRLERYWYSRKYDNAPMPHSIFFRGGYAIHGTTEIANLGRAASHGCVRLHPDHARILFDLVRRDRAHTTITVRP